MIYIFFVKHFKETFYIILNENFLENPPFQGKNILKEIFIKYYVNVFCNFYEGGLARIWLMMNFWLSRLLVENPFEDYYVGLHLQNDLCYGYC